MAHIDRQEILDRLEQVTVKPGERYQHYKTGGIYIVEKIVVLEAADELAVSYHDEIFPEVTWIRPYTDFIVKVDDQPRFSLLS